MRAVSNRGQAVDEPHQRARGALRLSFRLRGGATVLDGLRQEGCLKARFPRPERGAWAGAVALNTAGGVAAGDVLTSRVSAGPGTAATVAAPARTPPAAARAALRTSVLSTGEEDPS